MGNLSQQFRQVAARQPDAVAISECSGPTSYARLLGDVIQLRQRLLEHVATRSEPVAVLTGHNGAMIRALFGIWDAGRIAVPLDASLPVSTLRERRCHATCRIVVCDQQHLDAARQVGGAESTIILLDEPGSDQHPIAADTPPETLPAASDAALIVYTSGSTGRPRGVVHTHETLAANARHHIDNLAISPADRGLWIATASTISGLTDSLRILLAGGMLLPCELTTAGLTGLIEMLDFSRPTIVHFVPTIFRRLISHVEKAGRASLLQSVRVLHLGGETVTRRDLELFRTWCPEDGLLLHNLGCTEVPSFRHSLFRKTDRVDEPILPLNSDVPGKSVRLVDEANGEPIDVPQRSGEIVVTSRLTAAGYWRDDELTARSFRPRPDGAVDYHTGDLGCWTSDGTLIHLGRNDQQIKVLGRRIDLAAIEAELSRHPRVDEVAVVAVPGRQTTSLIVCYASADRLPPDELRATKLQSCDSTLLREFLPLPELPTLPNGKIDRRQLGRLIENRANAQPLIQSRPLSPTEQQLADIWRSVLQRDDLSTDDDFFRIGGDSLLAVDLLLKINQRFHQRWELGDLIANPTIRTSAANLEQQSPSGSQRRCLTIIHSGPEAIVAVGGFDIATPLRARLLVNPGRGLAVLKRPGARDLGFRYPSVERSIALYRSELAGARIESPAAIVGFSYGGLLAYALAGSFWDDDRPPKTVMLIEPTLPFRQRTTNSDAGKRRSPATWFRAGAWGDAVHYAQLAARSLLGRPLSAREDWDLFRPVLRRNLRTYSAPAYRGGVLLVGSNEYLAAHRAAWQQLVAGNVQAVSLGKHAGHFGFRRPESQNIWIPALLDRTAE